MKCLVKSVKLAVETNGEIDYVLVTDIIYMYREEKVTKIVTGSRAIPRKIIIERIGKPFVAPFLFFAFIKALSLI